MTIENLLLLLFALVFLVYLLVALLWTLREWLDRRLLALWDRFDAWRAEP